MVGVAGGEEGPACWAKLKLGVLGRMTTVPKVLVKKRLFVCGGQGALGRYLQQGERRRGGLQFMISSRRIQALRTPYLLDPNLKPLLP